MRIQIFISAVVPVHPFRQSIIFSSCLVFTYLSFSTCFLSSALLSPCTQSLPTLLPLSPRLLHGSGDDCLAAAPALNCTEFTLVHTSGRRRSRRSKIPSGCCSFRNPSAGDLGARPHICQHLSRLPYICFLPHLSPPIPGLGKLQAISCQ